MVYGCLVNNMWTYSNLSKFKEGTPVCEIITGIYESDNWQEAIEEDSNVVQVDPETVGEYTGLKDKNREDIYENDILKIINPWDELEWTTKVRYESGVFCVDVEGYDYNVTPLGYIDEEFIIEKIGNSYTRTF